jgi:nucleotide-binding universal stress UspA family protein
MLDSILVPLDGSALAECVLPHTVAFAGTSGAKVTLLRVVEQSKSPETVYSIDPLSWQISKTEASLNLEKVAADLNGAGLQTETVVLEGAAAERIVEHAQSNDINLIILSSHGQSGLSQWGISSSAQKIILSAPTSLLIVRANLPVTTTLSEPHYKQILVPLDSSWRAESVLPLILPLARNHRSKLHIVHVVDKPVMARRTPPTEQDLDLVRRITERNREEATRYLEQFQSRLPVEGIDSQTHLLIDDDPAAALHEFAERERIELVALSAHGYTGSNRWPYGSVVSNFIFYGKSPLLIVQDLPLTRDVPTQADQAVREHPGY